MRRSSRTASALRRARFATTGFVAIATLAVPACASGGGDSSGEQDAAASATSDSSEAAQRHPDVVGVDVTADGADSYTFSVTISSPYDSPERYADAWRVVAPDGTVLGVRELSHDHATEQPFTRTLDGVEVPEGVDTVTVEGRDLANGWGGATVEVQLP